MYRTEGIHYTIQYMYHTIFPYTTQLNILHQWKVIWLSWALHFVEKVNCLDFFGFLRISCFKGSVSWRKKYTDTIGILPWLTVSTVLLRFSYKHWFKQILPSPTSFSSHTAHDALAINILTLVASEVGVPKTKVLACRGLRCWKATEWSVGVPWTRVLECRRLKCWSAVDWGVGVLRIEV